MDKSPFFSIIIPTFNRAEKLRRALLSIERQTFRDFEVIICDDGSQDDTKSIVNSFAGKFPINFISENNWGGPARPRNNGLRLAKGEWVCLLDADDWWYPPKLAKVAKYTQNTDVVHHAADLYTPRGKSFLKVKGRRFKHPFFVDLMLNGNGVINSCASVRTIILREIGGFAEEKRLIAVEDYDLWLRLSLVSEKFVYLPESLGAYWRDEGNITKFSRAHMERVFFVIDKHKLRLNDQQRFQAETVVFYIKARIAGIEGNHNESITFFKKSAHSHNLQIRLRSVIFLMLTWVKRLFSIKEPARSRIASNEK